MPASPPPVEPFQDADLRRPRGYVALTRTATYGFLAALPLFVLYEVGIRLAQGQTGVRVSADVWLKDALARVGVGGTWPVLLAVAVLGAVLVVWERRRVGPVPLVPRYFGGLVAESAAYALVSGSVVAAVVGAIFAQVGGGAVGLGTQLALSLGAGLYEELFFRVLLVGGLAAVLRRAWAGEGAVAAPAAFDPVAATARLAGRPVASLVPPSSAGRRRAYVVAAVVGALIFSGVHYVGAYADAFALPSFTFRFLLGLVLNGLYLTRGFGVAAWTHALYDVFVTLQHAGS